jgi:hypothetical protein
MCGVRDVVVTGVEVRATAVIVCVECKKCRHAWTIDGETPPLRRKPDRRHRTAAEKHD